MPPRICTTAKPPTPMISVASRAAIARVTAVDGDSVRSATARPAARKTACPTTTAVLSTITEASPSSSGSRSRTRYALRGSPPTEAVGVSRFADSPARRAPASARHGTRQPGRSTRQPSVSRATATQKGKSMRSPSRQDSVRMVSHTVAGPRSQTSHAMKPTPTARRSGRSSLPVTRSRRRGGNGRGSPRGSRECAARAAPRR